MKSFNCDRCQLNAHSPYLLCAVNPGGVTTETCPDFVTQRSDGKWRSLHNDAIYRQQKLLGMAYQHHLALEVQKLGYQVVAKGQGQFEIAGFQPTDLEKFSKRRQLRD